MSRLARALVLAATLAAMTLVGLTAAAQAHPASDDAARRQALAQERYYESFDRRDNATQAALARERYYSTWRPGEEPTAPAQPGRAQPGGRRARRGGRCPGAGRPDRHDGPAGTPQAASSPSRLELDHDLNPQQGATMRRFALVLAVAAALTIAASSGAFAAAPLVNEHNQFTETFPDELCDSPGITTVSAVDNFKLYADGTFLDTSRFQVVFTAADSGKSIMISSAGQAAGLDEPIQNPDGTVTFITTFKGLPEKLSIPGGPTLSLDAGVVTVTTTLRPLGDDEFEFVSQTFSGEHGPHPDLESGFELFCQVLVPALT